MKCQTFSVETSVNGGERDRMRYGAQRLDVTERLVVNDDEGRQRRQPGPHAFEGARRDVNVLPDKKRWLENDLVPRDLPARSDQSRRSY